MFGLNLKPKPEKQRSLQDLRLFIRQCEFNSEQVVGARPLSLRLKPMKSQWGSCNSQGIIAINTKLIYLPGRLVAYIVHHEVVHLKIHAHNRAFREMVERLFPDRKLLDAQLKHFAYILRQNL